MKKLLALQVVVSSVLSLIAWPLGLELWQIVAFVWAPIFTLGYLWLWWFRNVYFYRDPDRPIPQGDDLVVAPADGRIMYLHRVRAGEVVSDKRGRKIRIDELAKTDIEDTEGWLLGIYMSPFDVHFNRAPIGGQIETVHYHRTGANLPMVDLWEYVNFTLFRRAVDMFARKFHLENERLTIHIRDGRKSVFLILIADQFVNKISRFFRENQRITMGEKICFIERGSQTDMFIPFEGLLFAVKPGDQVYAGKTVLATLER